MGEMQDVYIWFFSSLLNVYVVEVSGKITPRVR